MESDEIELVALRRAGSAALEFNTPLSSDRADRLVDFVGAHGQAAVDLGCGRGGLALRLATAGVSVVGVDSDPGAIDVANQRADDLGVSDRTRFVIGDAEEYSEWADVAACIGSSHAVGGTEAMFAALARLAGGAVVGDGVWVTTPDAVNAERFGDLPHGLESLEGQAEAAGWTVAGSGLSTLEEWDEFEGRWVGGVREVGTAAADCFADQRAAEYLEYRGVLGFAWLCLTRPSRFE